MTTGASAISDEAIGDLTVGAFVERQVARYPDRPLLRFQDECLTAAQVNEGANRVANGLRRLGVAAGDIVCILLPNCLEFFSVWLGIAKIGAIEVPINTAHRGRQLAYVIGHSGARAIVADSRFLPQLGEVAAQTPYLELVVVRGALPDASSGPTLPSRLVPLAEVMESSADDPPRVGRPADLVAIIYTSGTTGPARGVMISHKFALWSSIWPRRDRPVQDDLVHYCSHPLFHAVHLRALLNPLHAGESLAFSERFSASRFWDDIRRYNANTFMFVGAMLPILWAQPERPDDGENPVIFATGNPVPPDIHRPFEERFRLQLLQSYAMTEAMPITRTPFGRGKLGSSGVAVPGVELRVVDDLGRTLAAGQEGEFVVRNDEPQTMMAGYYKMPAETARAFAGPWFHTGDRGRLDEDGYLFFASRTKDMIRRSGENISAFDLEQEVGAHPAVLECAAVGIASDTHGDEVKVVIVLKEGARLAPEELIDFCEQRMARFMVPRYVEFVTSLPKTALLRAEKFKLREAGITPNTWDRERAGYGSRRDQTVSGGRHVRQDVR